MSQVAAGSARVHELFAQQVGRHPGRTAAVVGSERLDYAGLARRADRVAAALVAAGVRRGDLVGVCLERGRWLLPSLLGVLKTGAAYVPLDPAYPAERLDYIAADAGLTHVVVSAGTAALMAGTPAAGVQVGDELPDASFEDVPGDPSDAAYIIYTSGSTGRPKGVILEHRQVANFCLSYAEQLSPAERAGMLAAASVCFDASIIEIMGPLASGGTVILSDNLLALHTLPARDAVTAMFGVPSALLELLREPLPAGVRTVMSGGEAASALLVEKVYANPGVRRLVNVYGPTETTVYVLAAELDRDAVGVPPLGGPFGGALLSVRSADGVEVAPGEQGELWVAGPGVAREYLGRPELTAEKFADGHYRTGDLISVVDGVYRYHGRLDDQVKVRGFRIELGEVEAALAGHPLVTHAVALAPADDYGTRRLIGYAEAPAGLGEAELRSYLAGILPAHEVPSRIVVLERLPISPNGKVDRHALPAPAADEAGARKAYLAPRTETEALVARTVAEVLELDRVGLDEVFTELGGHSLAAARVCALIGRAVDVPVPLAAFLAAPTPAGLAAAVDVAARAGRAVPVRHRGLDAHPLTEGQKSFWMLRELIPHGTASTVAFRFELSGLPDAPARLRAALDGLVARHEVLRTSFASRGDDAVQLVHAPAPVSLEVVDGAGLDAAARTALFTAHARYCFDLAGSERLRGTLVDDGAGSGELLLVVDHIAFDGPSIGPLVAQLVALLSGDELSEPGLQMGDLGRWEAEHPPTAEQLAEAAAYWRGELAAVPAPTEISGRRRAALSEHRGERVTRPVPAELAARVAEVTATRGLTQYAQYLAALQLAVAARTGRAQATVGAAVARRDLPGVADLLGPLGIVLPVAVDFADDPSFAGLAARAAAATVRSMRYVDVPPVMALPAEERGAGSIVTPVLLSMQPPDVPLAVERRGVGLAYAGDVCAGGTQADLSVFATEGVAGPVLQVEYDLELFDRADAESFADLVLGLLAAGLAGLDEPVSRLRLVGPAEAAELVALGAGPELPPGRAATVVDAILAQDPAAVAVTALDGTLNYAELVDASARIAGVLRAAGAGPAAPVGVCVPRDRMLPAALLGVLRAGAAYVPLDPEHPADRLAWLAADAGAELVLARGTALAAARAVPGVLAVDLDAALAADLGAPLPAVGPDGLAYVLYTSGSTGTPKGVEVGHDNLAAHAAAIAVTPGLRPGDVVPALAPLTFDATGLEIWSPLAAGATVAVVERSTALDGHALALRLAEVGATAMFATPTMLRMLRAAGWVGKADLRVWAGGEAVDPTLADELLPVIGELWNAYGPTEATTLSVAHRVTAGGAAVPIGRTLPGEHAYVMDPLGRLVPRGVVGELWLGGTGVARGYRGRPDLTAAAFTADPYAPGGRCYRTGDLVRWTAAGRLDFLGRRDHQVKVRGQRMELGEIEAALLSHPRVEQAVVVVHGAGPAASLVGYLCPNTVDPAEIEAHVRSRLPEYMTPRRWMLLDSMPVLPSGKADRGALPEPAAAVRQGEAPATAVEEFVAEVWAEVTGAEEVFREDDFFALGGNSFAATRVVGRIRAVLGCEVPVAALFTSSTLIRYAAEVERIALEALELEEADEADPSAAGPYDATVTTVV